MENSYEYSYSNGGYIFSSDQIERLKAAEQRVIYLVSEYKGNFGLAAPIYETLLKILPKPFSGFDAYINSMDYYRVHEWIKGGLFVNRGDGIFSDYINGYTAIQYRLRFGESGGDELIGAINNASNSIALALVSNIINKGILPSIEGLGVVDAGASARSIFENESYYPDGDYTGWAGTLLFPFLGYDRFFKEWLINENRVSADIDFGTNEREIRTIKKYEGSYDLLVALQANHEVIEGYGIWEKFLASMRSKIDNNQDDLIEATNSYISRIYGLEADNPFQVGNMLPFASAAAYLLNDIAIRVGSLKRDVIDDFWEEKEGNYIVHAGEGDDVILIPPFIERMGGALIDGGSGIDLLVLDRGLASQTPLFIKMEDISNYDGVFHSWRFSIGKEADRDDDSLKALVYSVERLETGGQSDWLKVQSNINLDDSVYVNLKGGGVYGNTLDLSEYSSGVDLNVLGGTVSSLLANASSELSVRGVNNIVGTVFDDVLSGDSGDNIIDAGKGFNILNGGGGSDVFIVDQGYNVILDADSDDKLVVRIPGVDSGLMLQLKGGVVLRSRVEGDMGADVMLSANETAYFHPVTPDPKNYQPAFGDYWPVLPGGIKNPLIVSYKMNGDDLQISTKFMMDGGMGVQSSEILVKDYEDGDFGIGFKETVIPNYYLAASSGGDISEIVDNFERMNMDLQQPWLAPPGFSDVWIFA